MDTMHTELEAKFLDIYPETLREKLKAGGARQVHKERVMRRKVFDFPDLRLEKTGAWIRVRDEGDKITLSFKQLIDRSLCGTKEMTVAVSDFEEICKLLKAIGLEERSYQETKREKWLWDTSEITIDTWPWIPTFVEIEGESEEKIRDHAQKLGFDWNAVLHGSVETAYQKYYDVTEEEVDSWPLITFSEVPEWLVVKKKRS